MMRSRPADTPLRPAARPTAHTLARASLLACLGWQFALHTGMAQAQLQTGPLGTAGSVQGQTAAQVQAEAAATTAAQTPPGLRITPVFDMSVSVVNTTLETNGGPVYDRSGDIVTQLRPGLQMTGRLGRSYGSLYYALDLRRHSRPLPGQADADRAKNALNAQLNTELVDGWLFLDAAATVSQQALSAYGQQSVDGVTYNSNRTEVTQLSVRPYAQGAVSGLFTYELMFSADTVRVKSSLSPDSSGNGASLSLASPNAGAVVGWGLQFSQQHSAFSGGQATDSSRATLSLQLRPDPEIQGALRVGQESTKITDVYDASYTNYGAELRWTPSPRTTALLSGDQRYFGRAYQVAFEHRLSRASVRFTSGRDVSSSANAAGVGAPVTLYQLFFNQFASLQPDPVLREQMVRDFLASIGQDPNAMVSGGFVNGGVTLQRREDLALSYTARRGTFSLQAYSNLISRLDTPGSLVGSGTSRQYGLTASGTYRLTPERNASLTFTRLVTRASDALAGNQLTSLSLNLSERLGRYTTASVNARYSLFDGPFNPYHETSLGASVSLRF